MGERQRDPIGSVGGFGHRGPGGPGGPGEFGPLAGLNLTDAQKEQVKKIHDSFDESTKALRDQMRTLHDNDTADPLSGNFDEAAFRSAAEARAKIQVEMEVQHAKMMSQVAAILTPDQKPSSTEIMCRNVRTGATCQVCGLCAGSALKAKHVAMPLHGSKRVHFHRNIEMASLQPPVRW